MPPSIPRRDAGKFPAGTEGYADEDRYRLGHALLDDSGEDQLAKLRRNPAIMDILLRLKGFSVSLVGPSGFGEGVPAPMDVAGGAGGGATVRRVGVARVAQEGYLRLFEEMLSELLKIQREKSKVGAK